MFRLLRGGLRLLGGRLGQGFAVLAPGLLLDADGRVEAFFRLEFDGQGLLRVRTRLYSRQDLDVEELLAAFGNDPHEVRPLDL